LFSTHSNKVKYTLNDIVACNYCVFIIFEKMYNGKIKSSVEEINIGRDEGGDIMEIKS